VSENISRQSSVQVEFRVCSCPVRAMGPKLVSKFNVLLIRLLISALYVRVCVLFILFVFAYLSCLLSFLFLFFFSFTSLLISPSGIGPLRILTKRRRRQPNLVLVDCVYFVF